MLYSIKATEFSAKLLTYYDIIEIIFLAKKHFIEVETICMKKAYMKKNETVKTGYIPSKGQHVFL